MGARPMLEMYMHSVRFRIGRGNARAAMPMIIDLKARGCICPEHMFTKEHARQEAAALIDSAKPLFVREAVMRN